MQKILLKIKTLIISRIRQRRMQLKYRKVAGRTQKLRQEKKSDYSRWANQDELQKNWDERTLLISKLVSDDSKVIEFGSGNGVLRKYLPSGCTYQGSDLVKRFPDLIVCDLNEGINFSLREFDTAIFSGVLEYVYDLDRIFSQLKEEIGTVIMSYCCKDLSTVNRLKMGWLSDFERKDLENTFFKNGFKIIEYMEWKGQSIYKLKRK
jgi:hypothetical protein